MMMGETGLKWGSDVGLSVVLTSRQAISNNEMQEPEF